MKLHLAQTGSTNVITAYGEGFVEINKQRHQRSLVVMPARVWADWGASTFEALCAEDFDALAGLDQEVILLGTGGKLRFPHPALMKKIMAAGIGLEVMDVPAACRTYNILVAEERKVAAALLLA